MLSGLFKKKVFPIGVDLGSGYLKMAQLQRDDKGLHLKAAAIREKPYDISVGTAEWQKWIAETTPQLIAGNGFKGKEVIAAMPAKEVFIEQVQIPRVPEKEIAEAVASKVANKLPFDIGDAMIKHVCSDSAAGGQLDVLVMAAEKQKVYHNLAIYEKAGLSIKGICVWPIAGVNVYVNFFGRRQSDAETVVLLVEIGMNHTSVTICRHKQLLFARLISIGFSQINNGQMSERLISEIDACGRYFESSQDENKIERLVLFSDKNINRTICDKIADFARSRQIPAQIGDVLAAVGVRENKNPVIDRRGPQPNWSMAFGLSLDSEK